MRYPSPIYILGIKKLLSSYIYTHILIFYKCSNFIYIKDLKYTTVLCIACIKQKLRA